MRVTALMLHADAFQTVYREIAMISRPEIPINVAGLGSGIMPSPKLAYRRLVIHVTHAAAHWPTGRWRLLRPIGDHRFGCQHQRTDRGGVLQGRPYDFGRIDNSSLDHVLEF